MLAERLVDNKEALNTRLDPVQEDKTEHDVTIASSSPTQQTRTSM
jgi:hypothetical protein